jgi:hypothetical protein
MDRRDFLRKGMLALGAGVSQPSFARGTGQIGSQGASGRLVFPLNRNWRYSPKLVEGVHAPEFDDSSFEPVVVPQRMFVCPGIASTRRRINFLRCSHHTFEINEDMLATGFGAEARNVADKLKHTR